ncbi:hypothetical protein TI39_contig513g00007 [Zymoseptoria brevis]|uniref:Tim44-like domain-containing protein n=1 Tax=Zymoseptoria brevis TaxID=1047168 RepID=A0A0F4GJ45_9PEZI|nr:hypothetical protein TI39_contig513g00007 [Zymoseptoria brevis]
MSKRLCVSFLPSRCLSSSPLQPCSAALFLTAARNSIISTRNHALPRRRPFNTTPPHHAVSMSRMRPRQGAQPSIGVAMKKQQKEAERDGSVLDMVGILDGTFIYPSGSNLPSWTKNPRGRWKIEFRRIWTAITDWSVGAWYRVWVVRPRMWTSAPLQRGEVVRIAKEVYESMYDNFARGTLGLVEKDLKAGLLGSLRARLAQRPPNSGLHWTMHGYLQRPKVMSFKFLTMPGGANTERNGVVQAVVKIRSKQSLLKVQRLRVRDESGKPGVKAVPVDSHGLPIPEGDVEEAKESASKVTTEYVVLQRVMKKGKLGPWQMWGTAEESSLAKVAQDTKDMVAKQDAMAAMRGQS